MNEELKDLYERGENAKIVEIVTSMLKEVEPDDEIILAWAYFNLGEYKKALDIAMRLEAFELVIQLVAYVSKGDKLIEEIRQKFPNNLNVCNALAIRARDADSDIQSETIILAALKCLSDDSIGAINLLNNTARLLLEKGDSSKDVVIAIGFWQIALVKYGDKNYHHRAAIHFWLSKAYERIGVKGAAKLAARESAVLWKKQLSLDSSNKRFEERFDGALKRIQELE